MDYADKLDMMDDDCDIQGFPNDDITKGRIKISQKDTPTKSRHKHNYCPVLIIHKWDDHNHYSAGVKCSICNKIRWDESLFNKLTNTDFPFLGFSDKHFVETYRKLEIVEENK